MHKPHVIAHSGVRQSHLRRAALFRTLPSMEPKAILAGLQRLGVTHDEIADAIGRDRSVVTKMYGGTRQMKAAEIPVLEALLADREIQTGDTDQLPSGRDYLEVEVLPSFAGMGGGGTGEGDRSTALISRALIEDQLHAKPADLLVIEVRGTSMEPDFLHGDQILVDRRDCNPVQPGPFALWDGDGYVVKLVERIPRAEGRYRIFSANTRFREYDVSEDEIKIMGRPVWFGRRL